MNRIMNRFVHNLAITCIFSFFIISPLAGEEETGNSFRFDSQVKLGTVERSEANPDAAGILKYGLATKVKQTITFDDVKTSGANVVFPATTKEIFWYALFGLRGSLKNNISRSYSIEWYSPGEKLYHKQKFKSGFWNETFVKTPLKLQPPLQDSLIGVWHVRVWKKDTLIDDRYFEIVKV